MHASFDQKGNDFATSDTFGKNETKITNFKVKTHESLGNKRGHLLRKAHRSKDPDFSRFDRSNIYSKTVIIKPY